MQYFNVNGAVHCLDDGINADDYIKQPYIVITSQEASLLIAINNPPPKPTSCTMKQARLALLKSNYLPQVTTAMSQASTEAQIIWEFSTVVDRNDALVTQMATVLGLTAQQLDDLFALAITL